MQFDAEYLHNVGLGLQSLRASGQFCDAMVCVGSTRILAHKVVLSAASKVFNELALEFDMTPHGERDQLEIIIPTDISLYAVNMFIKYLYTGQLDINERTAPHLQRLASIYAVSRLEVLCQEFIQRTSAPDSQNLNLKEEHMIEPDSSCPSGTQAQQEEHVVDERSRSSSSCSGIDLASISSKRPTNKRPSVKKPEPLSEKNGPSKLIPTPPRRRHVTDLEKLMSPVVNLTKLPSNITPDTVVLVSDDENEDSPKSHQYKPSSQFTLQEKKAIALEAKRSGTTQVAKSRNINPHALLHWMSMFGLHHLEEGQSDSQESTEEDRQIVKWIIQHQEMNGCVDMLNLKRFATNVYKASQPNFQASSAWLVNLMQQNYAVLQSMQFVRDFERSDMIEAAAPTFAGKVSVKREFLSLDDVLNENKNATCGEGEHFLEGLGQTNFLDNVSLNEQMQLHESVGSLYNDDGNDNDGFDGTGFTDLDESSSHSESLTNEHDSRIAGSILTPFGKKPIIIGQAKSFDAKSERKIVQWVLERNERDGYVFTDDFKDYARTLYHGSKPFGATQAWMKKFLRRNRVLKDVKFCSKFKNTYTAEEKLAAVAMARRFGSSYASKKTGISHKMIHTWKLQMDRGQLTAPTSRLDTLAQPQPSTSVVSSNSTLRALLETPPNPLPTTVQPAYTIKTNKTRPGEALHGIVPELEQKIVEEIKALNTQEGSVNYDEISQISQAIYKETRPAFKASYNWIRSFLDRHRESLMDIELENISKVVMEDEFSQTSNNFYTNPEGSLSSDKISELVDNALKEIEQTGEMVPKNSSDSLLNHASSLFNKDRRPVVVGPSVTFNRKTEKQLVEWVLERQAQDGFVFTDDFKDFAKSVHKGPKHFSASSGWLTLFLRRHRNLKDIQWKSKFKNNYSEEEKRAAVMEAKRLGAGHVGRQLGIDPALICAWKIKMDKSAPKVHTFWKGTKIRKFGKGLKNLQPKFHPVRPTAPAELDASRGIVPEFEHRIVELILDQHEKEGSISYEEMSKISQSVYKETRPTFKASYAWIRSFMKRHEQALVNLNIDNVKKVFYEDDPDASRDAQPGSSNASSGLTSLLSTKRPIIVGMARTLDTKTEKKLVEWMCAEQAKNGYVFLSKFKEYAQSLYKGEKKFAATQAWRIKFMRRNHNAVKHINFTSSFRNQYSIEEKLTIVQEAKKYGTAYVAKQTGIDHCLVNAWRQKLERDGLLPKSDSVAKGSQELPKAMPKPVSHISPSPFLGKLQPSTAPVVFSVRGIVPEFERKIVSMINDQMDREGSVSYQDVSNIARAVYKETRPTFKACYKWIKRFIERHKKDLKHVEFEVTKIVVDDNNGFEVLIAEDKFNTMESLMQEGGGGLNEANKTMDWDLHHDAVKGETGKDPMVFIDNAEDPNYEAQPFANTQSTPAGSSTMSLKDLVSKKPFIVGTPLHFNKKTEKQMVVWLYERQNRDGFVFTDDFRDYARSLYDGPPGKFGATNAWINKFLRRNNMQNRISFQSRLKGNNPKYEEKIVELILEQQAKEGSVSNDDIQKITQSVYKDIRPNFRACYNWIKDFIKRHQEELKGVDLENVKKVFIPDSDQRDGVLINDIDHSKSFPFFETSNDTTDWDTYGGDDSHDSSWIDLDTSDTQSSSAATNKLTLLKHKRPVIIAPPKSLDPKTEKKLVQWMVEQQKEHGCVYLDLFKDYARSVYTGNKKFAATQAWMIKFKQRNHEALKEIQIRSRFRNEYTPEEKLAAVEEARRLGCHHVGRKLGINGSVIYSWKIQFEQQERLGMAAPILADTKTVESQFGMVPEFEQNILEMVLEKQVEKGSVSYEDISHIARSVYQETRPNFKASYNWVVDFIRKYNTELEHVTFENQRKANTDAEKLQILSEEKKYGTDHVVKKRNISASTIYHWKKAMQAKSIPIPKYKALVGCKIKKKYAKGKKAQTVYTVEEKRKVVAEAEKNGITHASLKLGISRNMIAKWVKYFRDQGENIVINFTHGSTLKKELEQKIVAWVLAQNEELGIVMTSQLKEYAQKVFQDAYTLFNATDSWLSSFISQNGEKFAQVRFRERHDQDLDFTEDIKLKLARYAEKHGAVKTAVKSGLSPKNIYHWRRVMRKKGHDLTQDAITVKEEENVVPPSEEKSLMQKKLDRIAKQYTEVERASIVKQATNEGASVTASWHKIPLPLLLSWMKQYQTVNDSSLGTSPTTSSTPETSIKLTVKLPGIEKMKSNSCLRYPETFKQMLLNEAKVYGCTETSRKHGIPNSTLYTWIRDAGYDSSIFDSMTAKKPVEKTESTQGNVGRDRKSLTPVSIANIKKEPGISDTPVSCSSSLSSSFENSPASSQGKVVRKYTDDEKLNVVKRALEIGVKATSVEHDIHISNVRRWTNMFKKKIQSKEKSAARRAPGDFFSTSATTSSSISPSSIKLTNLIPKRKIKEENPVFESELAKKRKLSRMYTDEDRIGFVMDSETIGTRQAAAKAGVSLDVLYKWRQKYLSVAKTRINQTGDQKQQTEKTSLRSSRHAHDQGEKFSGHENVEDDNSSSGESDGYEDIEDYQEEELSEFSTDLQIKGEELDEEEFDNEDSLQVASLVNSEESSLNHVFHWKADFSQTDDSVDDVKKQNEGEDKKIDHFNDDPMFSNQLEIENESPMSFTNENEVEENSFNSTSQIDANVNFVRTENVAAPANDDSASYPGESLEDLGEPVVNTQVSEETQVTTDEVDKGQSDGQVIDPGTEMESNLTIQIVNVKSGVEV